MNLSELTGKIRGSYDTTTKVTKANWMVVTDSQEQILDNLVECLAVLKSRKGDLDLDAHRKAIKVYRESVTSYWFYETKSVVIEDKNTTWPLLKQDTFLIRHLAVRLLAELRGFREDSEESAPAISALSKTIFSDVNAVLKWLAPAVDKSFGSPTELPRHLIDEQDAALKVQE